jgi:hypothetical protein
MLFVVMNCMYIGEPGGGLMVILGQPRGWRSIMRRNPIMTFWNAIKLTGLRVADYSYASLRR